MHNRPGVDKEESEKKVNKEEQGKPGSSSIARLKMQLEANTAAEKQGVNHQQQSTKADMDKLSSGNHRLARATPRMPSPSSVATSQNTAPILVNSSVSALRSKIFGSEQLGGKNAQQRMVEQEMARLKADQGRVGRITKDLEAYFMRSNQLLETIKTNKVSEDAKITLTNSDDRQVFEEHQVEYIAQIYEKLKSDRERYADSPTLQQVDLNRFLELSLTYRSYEVCLELDFIRHAAENLKTLKPISDIDLESVCAIPNKLAIQSLNYYQDFFKKLPAIKEIWSDAGVDIRKYEIRLLFAAVLCRDVNILSALFCDKDSKRFLIALCKFDDALDNHIRRDVSLQQYIECGDGLDIGRHPWPRYRYSRMDQPNTSMDFKNIAPIDDVHAHAIEEVKERSDYDRVRMNK